MKPLLLSLVAGLALAVSSSAVGHEGEPIDPSITEDTPRETSKLYLERKDGTWTKLEDGVQFQEVRDGNGAVPYDGALVYIMWRMFDRADGREIFYRTKHRTDHFFYNSGKGEAVGGGGTLAAVEKVLKDMREGGKRLLSIDALKAFGKEGWSDSHFMVPPNTDIVLELSLLWVRDPNPKRMTAGEPHPRPTEQTTAARKESPPLPTTSSAPAGTEKN